MATPKYNKARGLWMIQAQKDGKKKRFYSAVKGPQGKKIVIEKYNAWIDSNGVDGVTVAKCVALYLDDIIARLGKGETYREAELYTRVYVIPALGNKKMNKLSLREWQSVINGAKPIKKDGASLSHKTLTHLRAVITALHKFAYINYYCEEWRGALYIPAGHSKGTREILQPCDIARLFEPCDLWYINAFRVMLLCGLRPGECYGLQADDVGNGVLYIRRAVNDDGQITSGKNKNARRVVPLPELASSLINDTIARNKAAHFNTPWIFCNGVGAPASQDTARKQWNELKASRGIPGTPYSLRHTFVSIVSSQTHLAEGTIKELIGHSESMDTFGTYKHTVSNEIESAAEIINLTFERLKTAEQ